MIEFERLSILVGNDILNDIYAKTILIVGIGGVGGYTFESLVRSNVKKIIIIDNDTVDKTNINRQIIALNSTIGLSKVEVAKNRALDINSNIEIEAINTFLDEDNISLLDKYSIDYIVDACDSINTKFELIKYALKHDIKIISSMGTGKKLDASKLEITMLNKTYNDPLARILRKKLKDNNLNHNIPVVWSSEEPVKIDSTTIGSNSYVPATAGLLITNYIINDIIKSHK